MSKKSRYRECFDKQYGKCGQTLLKSASQHLYHIHWSLARKLCSKKSLLLMCKILGLLVNTLATDGKYPAVNRDNLRIRKNDFSIFCSAFEIYVNFWTIWKKDDPHSFLFPKLRTPKTLLAKCLKSHIWENPWTSNMANVP